MKQTTDSDDWTIVTEISHSPDITVASVTVENLQPDSVYTIRIMPGRSNNDLKQNGVPSQSITFRTSKQVEGREIQIIFFINHTPLLLANVNISLLL